MDQWRWLAVVAVVAAACYEVKSECTEAAFAACRSKLPFDATKATEDLTRNDFDRGCANLRQFENCVKSLPCTPRDGRLYGLQAKYLDTAEGYSYLCQPGTQIAFFANPACLKAGFAHHNGDCQQSVAPVQNETDRCRYINERAECARSWALRTCSDARVAQVVHTVIITTHRRQFEANHGCRIAPSTNLEVTTVYWVTAAVTGFNETIANRSQTKGKQPAVVCHEHVVSECPAYIQLRRNLSNLAQHKSEPNLDGICSQVSALRACVNRSRCSRFRSNEIRRTIDALNFLCENNTKQAYQANFDCLASNVTKKNLTACDKEGLASLFGFDCAGHRQTEACMRSVYEAGCGVQAANFIMRVHQKVDDHPCHSGAARITGLIAGIAAFSVTLSLRQLLTAAYW